MKEVLNVNSPWVHALVRGGDLRAAQSGVRGVWRFRDHNKDVGGIEKAGWTYKSWVDKEVQEVPTVRGCPDSSKSTRPVC